MGRDDSEPSGIAAAANQPEAEEVAEREIKAAVESGMIEARAALQKRNGHGSLLVAQEVEARQILEQSERIKRGLPPAPSNQHKPTSIVWNVRTYQEIQSNPAQKPPWKIEGLVVEGAATLVSAHPHAMKSLSWLQAALESVTTHKVWGHFDASAVSRSLFIEVEDPPWLVEARIRGIAKGIGLRPDQDVPGFFCACLTPFDLVEQAQALRDLLAKYKPDFAVLSTLQGLLGGRDWNQQDEMQPVNALIVELARMCPLVVLTHSPWNSKERRAAGTVTQTANYLTAMHYQKIMNRSDATTSIHVMLDSKAGSSIGDFHLELQTEGDENDPASVRGLIYRGKGWPKGNGKEAVLEAIEDDPSASASEIAKRAGVSDRYVRTIMKEQEAKSGKPRHPKKRPAARQVNLSDPNLLDSPLRIDPDADAFTEGQGGSG